MIYPGIIRLIDNKVKFEYYELEKPEEWRYGEEIGGFKGFRHKEYEKDLKEYEASKRVIEVSNEYIDISDFDKIFTKQILIGVKRNYQKIRNNNRCEAEVENNVAVIIKIN